MIRQLALVEAITENDRLSVTGLLHDNGHLFMYVAIPEESLRAIMQTQKLERPLYQ
jgi:hypothetical protein